jgi:hypothetical protein
LLSAVVLSSFLFLLSTLVRFFHIKVGVLKDEMSFATLGVNPDLAVELVSESIDEVGSRFYRSASMYMLNTLHASVVLIGAYFIVLFFTPP